MASTDAPNWWADVQQEREDLTGPGRRPAEDWLGEDIDFVPRRRISGGRRSRREATGAAHPLHGVFVGTEHAAATAMRSGSMTIELTPDGPVEPLDDHAVRHDLRHLSAADDPFATPPPPPGTRRTVQIKGRPREGAVRSLAQRHRPRTASDRVGPRPDRIAFWAVVLGAVLILLAASSSRAAVSHHAVAPRAAVVTTHHVAVAHHVVVRPAPRHR